MLEFGAASGLLDPGTAGKLKSEVDVRCIAAVGRSGSCFPEGHF